MRTIIATISVALLSIALIAPIAQAAPIQVNVRIEGRAETIFEGPVSAEVDGSRAASDDQPRRCDGINSLDPENTVPAPTPTSTSADAMAAIGETFDGKWYPDFDDYFITRWGPDEQSDAESAYWGIIVNNVYTNVGGCQYQLTDGDEVFWAYDAFRKRPVLALFPGAANYTVGTRPLTAAAEVGQPLEVEVASYEGNKEGRPPAGPERAGSAPFAGAEVAPVVTTAKGFERVNTKSSATVTTDGEGKASITFTRPGWHRIKATVVSKGLETAVRSNRLDVCVSGGDPKEAEKPLEGATGCGELPAADRVRSAPPVIGEVLPPDPPAGPAPSAPAAATTTAAAAMAPPNPSPGSLRISVPQLDRARLSNGRLGVSFAVLSNGPGIARWTISSRTLGRRGSSYVTRGTGSTRTTATIALPAGHTFALRFEITDRDGATSTLSLGKVTVPAARDGRRR